MFLLLLIIPIYLFKGYLKIKIDLKPVSEEFKQISWTQSQSIFGITEDEAKTYFVNEE